MMYGIQTTSVDKLVDWLDQLKTATMQKIRGPEADRLRQIVNQHDKKMQEILDDNEKKGGLFICLHIAYYYYYEYYLTNIVIILGCEL